MDDSNQSEHRRERRKRYLVALTVLLIAGVIFADPAALWRRGDAEESLSPASQRLIEKLANKSGWDVVASGFVIADWYLYRRPGAIGQAGRGVTASSTEGSRAVAKSAATKAAAKAGHTYAEAQARTPMPSAVDAAEGAIQIKFARQRDNIDLFLAEHGTEIPDEEREFWTLYRNEFLPGYDDFPGISGGTSHGDPHLRTFDGLRVRLQAVGEFVLVRSSIDDLEVQVRQSPYRNSQRVSVNSALAVRFDGHRITLDMDNGGKLHHNGTSLEPASSERIELADGVALTSTTDRTLILFTQSNVLISIDHPWNTYTAIDVDLPPAYRGKVRGIFGNYDGDTSNDLRRRDETALPAKHARQDRRASDPLYADFADSWRVTEDEALFDYPPGLSTADYTDRSFPREAVNLQAYGPERHEAARTACREVGVKDAARLEDCLYDLLVTRDRRFALSAAVLEREPLKWSQMGYFSRLDMCLRLACSDREAPVCESLEASALGCRVRWPDRADEKHLCARTSGRCERDDQCCGYMQCSSGRCAGRAKGELCVSTANCRGGLLCLDDGKARRCAYHRQ